MTKKKFKKKNLINAHEQNINKLQNILARSNGMLV